ncbi:MAG: GNAT family N-acetyltransferase [Chloroflexota bacterium]|nr:GNAT family N-acetyltransferase [Chloroflexota bacterium]
MATDNEIAVVDRVSQPRVAFWPMNKRMGFTVRRIERADTEQLTALVVESFADEISLANLGAKAVQNQIRSAVAASRPPAALLLQLAGLTFEFWVAVDGSRVLGCYALHGRSLVTLANLAVRPGMRGQGIGSALMEHAMERANGLGRSGMLLEVLADNEPAVRLYRSAGFQVYDCRRSYLARLTASRLDAPLNSRVHLVPITRGHVQSWSAVLRASVPPEALILAHTYRSEYVSNAIGRWFGERLTLTPVFRRAIMIDGTVGGFMTMRVPRWRSVTDLHVPLYSSAAASELADIIRLATREAAAHSDCCRLYLSEARAEGNAAALQAGYEPERLWSYMHRHL